MAQSDCKGRAGWRGARAAIGLAAAIAGLGLAGFAQASAEPRRVMSINQCTDQLLLQLLPPERIGSVTYLAQSGAVTADVRRLAARVGVNHGLAEEVLAQKPDLVLAEPFASATTSRLARQAGVTIVQIDSAEDFDDIRRITRQVAALVGEPARGEALIARMDATLAQLKGTAPGRPILAVGWNGGGYVPGQRSLFNAILTAAGGTNIAASPGFPQRSLELEELLALKPQPDLLLYGASADTRADLQAGAVRHPVLQRAFAHRRVTYPEAAYDCGTPQAADAAAALRQQMLRALGQAGRRP